MLAYEWAKHGINVNAIGPSVIFTPGMKAALPPEVLAGATALHPLGRVAEPEELMGTVRLPGLRRLRLHDRPGRVRRRRPQLQRLERGRDMQVKDVKKVAVFGAGTMGPGLALVFAAVRLRGRSLLAQGRRLSTRPSPRRRAPWPPWWRTAA